MGRQYKILLADDSPVDLEITRSFLQRRGFRVVSATDGPGALELAISEHPDVAVLDQVMPGLTGTEVCAALKARPVTADIPVVILTPEDTDEVWEACRAAGVAAVAPKLTDQDLLIEVIASLLQIPPRKRDRIAVFFTVTEEFEGEETEGTALDLSEGGICVEVGRPYPPGCSVALRFSLPGESQEITAKGRLCWINARAKGMYAMGVEFADISSEDGERVKLYLDRRGVGT